MRAPLVDSPIRISTHTPHLRLPRTLRFHTVWAGSGSCPHSPKAVQRRRQVFATDRLPAQPSTHTIGHQEGSVKGKSSSIRFLLTGEIRRIMFVAWQEHPLRTIEWSSVPLHDRADASRVPTRSRSSTPSARDRQCVCRFAECRIDGSPPATRRLPTGQGVVVVCGGTATRWSRGAKERRTHADAQ